jgi:serine/threonine protein kinase, bacterial
VAKANAAPPTEPRGGRLSRGAKIALAVGVVVLVAAVVSIIVVLGYRSSRTRPVSYSSQVVLPFPGISYSGVAVDTGGNLYVTDFNNNRVLKLAAGASVPTPLPFADLDDPRGVAVDTRGNLYVIESGRNPVLKLAAGASAPTVLPFTGIDRPDGVAVDTVGNVYVADLGHYRVLKLAAGATAPTVLPFTDLKGPAGVAVDTGGNLYIADRDPQNDYAPPDSSRVLKLAAGASAPTVLPFTGLNHPTGVAVDTGGGNLYVTDYLNNRALKLAAGASAPTVLPFTGLFRPAGVAVDTVGNVYVIDYLNFPPRVLKLPVQ